MRDETKKTKALEALQEIKRTEKKARRMIHDAREKKASRIIQEAYEKSKEIKEAALKQAREEAEKRKKAIIREATKEAEKIKKEAEEEGRALRSKTERLEDRCKSWPWLKWRKFKLLPIPR